MTQVAGIPSRTTQPTDEEIRRFVLRELIKGLYSAQDEPSRLEIISIIKEVRGGLEALRLLLLDFEAGCAYAC